MHDADEILKGEKAETTSRSSAPNDRIRGANSFGDDLPHLGLQACKNLSVHQVFDFLRNGGE
jgi:hypothetical protein